jgi:NAD(P)-dependent dehydrogenase (short-subunit alcohol dehydrogenase family)
MNFQLPDELGFLATARLPQKVSVESMVGKLCVLTGATTGIGFHTAIRLAKAGARIVAVVRSKDKMDALCQEFHRLGLKEPDGILADFSDLDQVRNAADELLSRYNRIDVLINNAGVHVTTRQLTREGHEVTFAVNHLASFLLTSLLLRRMVESAPSRIIQVNSEGHRFNGLRPDDLNWEKRRYNGYLSYGASKTAQLMTVWELNDLLKGKGVTINALHPGAVKSNIGTNNGAFYNWFSRYLIQPTLKSPQLSADAIYYLASSPEMEGVSGKFFNLTNEEPPAPHAKNRNLGRQVFEESIRLTKIQNDLYEV